MTWTTLKTVLDRKKSARDKDTCPDCGAELEQCEAADIHEDYAAQPDWAKEVTNAKRCTVEGCGFYYLRIGPGCFHMKPYKRRG